MVASARCQLTPAPRDTASVSLKAILGFTLMVWISDSIPCNRTTQLLSYSVFNPNGALSPTPTNQAGASCQLRYAFGTNAQSPASPPLPPSGNAAPAGAGGGASVKAVVDPVLLNSEDGRIRWPATTTCLPGSCVMPAGLK